ncbi:MAG TPA: ketopantoate reductase family protein [Solirubrobacteraceae bacterium]|nr:ketopantoate reductase family protein [Solirubrobacteraceae bacterium]
MNRVCIVGAGTIGSLLAVHLGRVSETWVLTRRADHARRLNEDGLTVRGKSSFHAQVHATADPVELPEFELGIVACKATELETVATRLEGVAPEAVMMTIQNGLGAEEVVARHGEWPLISAVTFMSGRRHGDVEVEYELDTATWLGPWAGTGTPLDAVRATADLLVAAGLRAEWMADLLPAQWSKLIFNSAVNGVASLTELPHVQMFAEEDEPTALGHVVRALIDEGKAVAAAAGVELYEDPWEMNCLAVARGETAASAYAHVPSMLHDVLMRQPTEVDFIAGAVVREAQKHGVSVPITATVHRLIKAKEASWALARERPEVVGA